MTMTDFAADDLADWLEHDKRHESCLDIHGAHGFLTALQVSASELEEVWLGEILGESLTKLTAQDASFFVDQCQQLYRLIGNELYAAADLAVPFDPTSPAADDPARVAWCQGFMEIVFAQPERWSHADEERLALLLLPIETGSMLFSEEDDFRQLYRQPKLLQQLLADIPQVVTDLYLLFHAPQR